MEFLDLADAVVCGVSRSPLEWGSKAALLVNPAVQPYIPSQSTASMSKPYCRLILILLTVACGVCALVTAPIAVLTAAMAFDAPDSDYQLWAWIVFFVTLSIPLWFVIGAAAGWAFYLQGWRRTSLVLAATPLGGATFGWLLLQLA